MKNKEEKKNRIWVPIVVGAVACSVAVGTGIALAHNQQRPKAGTVATVSDAVESVPSTTEVVEITTEEVTTEVVIETAVSGSEKPEAVPATTEIGGGKKKAEETTEEQKPSANSNNGSGHSNSGNASGGQSTTPKPSNSGNSGSSNSGNSGSNNNGSTAPATTEAPKPSTTEAPKPSTTEAPTTQHQHVYDQVVVDTPEQTIDYPEQGYYAPAKQCHGCHEIFTSSEAYFAHPCGDDYGFSTTQVWIKTGDPYTETIPAKTHRECKCGARE